MPTPSAASARTLLSRSDPRDDRVVEAAYDRYARDLFQLAHAATRSPTRAAEAVVVAFAHAETATEPGTDLTWVELAHRVLAWCHHGGVGR